MISALGHKSKFKLFWKKSIFGGFPWCSIHWRPFHYVSITNVGLILTKLRWFQLFVTSQNSNFFEKKNQFFGFPCCSTRKPLSIDISITNVGLIIIDEAMAISFLGVQTDGQTGFWNPYIETCMSGHEKFQLRVKSSKLVVSCRSLYASPEDGDA